MSRVEDMARGVREPFEIEIAKLTRLLCEAMGHLATHSTHPSVSPELQEWWQSHQKKDQEQEAKRKALAKLTQDERDLLGLKEVK